MPQSGRATRGTRPKASVRMQAAEEPPSYVCVPVSVARHLEQKRKSHELENPIEESRFMSALQTATEQTAVQVVYKLLTKRDYSVLEVRSRLLADGFSEDVTQKTIQRFVDGGLLSNQRFAEAFIRRKMAAGQGIERIKYELGLRGVDVGDLKGWPSAYADPETERERALTIASRKTVRDPNAYAKTVRFLSGRGFSLSISKSVAREVVLDS